MKRPPLKRFKVQGLESCSWNNILWEENNKNDEKNENNTNDKISINNHSKLINDDDKNNENDKNKTNKNKNEENRHISRFVGGDHQTLKFAVAREEKYVRTFRVESLCCGEEDDENEVATAFYFSSVTVGVCSNDKSKNKIKNGDNDNDRNSNKNKNGNYKNNRNGYNDDNNNDNDDKKEMKIQFIEYFYTLLQSFLLKPALSLPFQIMLPILLVPIGRGTVRDGTVIYSPNECDYINFIYCHERRAESTLSCGRQSDERLGEWRGENLNVPGLKNVPGVNRECNSNIDNNKKINTNNNNTSTNNNSSSSSSSSSRGNHILNSDSNSHNNSGNDSNSYSSGTDSSSGRKVIGYITSGRYHGSPFGMSSYGLCDAIKLNEMQRYAAQLILKYADTDTDTVTDTDTDTDNILSVNNVDKKSNRNRNEVGSVTGSGSGGGDYNRHNNDHSLTEIAQRKEKIQNGTGTTSVPGPEIFEKNEKKSKYPRGKALALVLFQSPRSKWLRPGLIEIISVTP